MYVISFYNEAIVEAITDGKYKECVERKNSLCKLVR
jgi:hypothetical protein